jgi:hypothetical protein
MRSWGQCLSQCRTELAGVVQLADRLKAGRQLLLERAILIVEAQP